MNSPRPKWLVCGGCGMSDAVILNWGALPSRGGKRLPYVSCRICKWKGFIYDTTPRWTQQELDNGDHLRA